MSFTTGQKITRYSWDNIQMSDTVIDWVKTLVKDQLEHLNSRDRNFQLIAEVDLTWVDGETTDTPQQIKTVDHTEPDQSDTVNE